LKTCELVPRKKLLVVPRSVAIFESIAVARKP